MKDPKEFKIKIINALSFKNNNKIVFFLQTIWSLLTSIIFLIKKKTKSNNWHGRLFIFSNLFGFCDFKGSFDYL